MPRGGDQQDHAAVRAGDLPAAPREGHGHPQRHRHLRLGHAGGKSVTFSASIKKPAGNGLFPAIITIGGSSLPIPGTVATINFGNDDFASQASGSSRGPGQVLHPLRKRPAAPARSPPGPGAWTA